MSAAATLGFAELTRVIRSMPDYASYAATDGAAAEERAWRLALGCLLKECGDQLLRVVERHPQLITDEQHDTIDTLIERIGGIFRRLNRGGEICLPPDDRGAISELEEIDLRMLALLEEARALTRALSRDARSSRWFTREAARLSRGLAALGEATQARNLLLGLDWDAEGAGMDREGRLP